jgi:phosphatidylcholine synthase
MSPHSLSNKSRTKGYAVHLLTASGAALGMFALQSVINGDARGAMLWLVASQILDGLDGPIARRFDVKIQAPSNRWSYFRSGNRLRDLRRCSHNVFVAL